MMKKRKKTKAKKSISHKYSNSKKKKVKESDLKKVKKIKVRLVGIGGGGGSIVSEIAQRVKGASFFAANTDYKALERLPKKVKKFYFGQELTHGLGTGMNPEIGEEAAKNEKEKIKKILEGQDFIILIACLGGGVGSGSAPVFAKISKDLGNLTYGIFTLPFKFEGEKKMEIAKNSLEELRTKLNALSVIPNERIFKIIEKTAPLKKALSAINKTLSESIQSLIGIIYNPGLINIDFADFKTIFEGRGRLTYLNSMEIGKGEEDEAFESIINSSLYPYSIDGAKGVLFNISGQKDLSLLQVNHISDIISKRVYKEAKIIFGISKSKKGSKIKVSLLATGCKQKIFPEVSKKILKKKRKQKEEKAKNEIKKEEKKKEPGEKPRVRRRRKRRPKARTKARKIKVKISSTKLSIPPQEDVDILGKKETKEEKKDVRIRKNAIQVRKEIEEEEAKIISKEKFWETPTFLRKKSIQG